MNQSLSNLNALPVIETVLSAAPPTAGVRPAIDSSGEAEGWQAIERQIIAWAPASGEPDARLDEDGYLLPSGKAAAAALKIVARLREAGVAIPLRSGQTANGGVNFEWRRGTSTERLTVNARGEAELAKFKNSKLVSRTSVTLG
ncbi:MAG TPA: hypothetical protein VF278_00905 [Pirellulales bacterium]